jgi:hypothetical protein
MGRLELGPMTTVIVVPVSSSTVMAPPVGVKGPSEPAGLGKSRASPLSGTGFGMATL